MALFLCPKHWLIRAMRGGVMQRLALLPGKGDILSRERMAPVFSHKCKGSCGTGAAGKAAPVALHGEGGYSLSRKRVSPLNPREKGRGAFPLDPAALAVLGLKSYAACGIGCGVRGFATSLCESLPVSTAPYYREARVTIARRRTACWRHCCARRGTEAKNDRVSGRFLLWESHRAPVRKLRCGA